MRFFMVINLTGCCCRRSNTGR